MGRVSDSWRVLTGRARVSRGRGPGADYWYTPRMEESSTGIEVDERVALESTAIYAGISLIADCMGMVACHLYRTGGTGASMRTEIAADDPLDRLLYLEPNPAQTAMEFWRWMFASMKVRGNAYAEIVRGPTGRVEAIWPLISDRMELSFPAAAGGAPVYTFTLGDGRRVVMPARNVLHLTDFYTHGFVGENNLMRHKEAIGLSIALEQYAAKFFGNGGMTGAVLIFPPDADFSANDKAVFRAEFEKLNSGLSNAHRVAIIEEGATYHQIGVSPRDSQAIDCRTYQVGEAARILRVPRVMLGDLADAHQKNIEHLFIQFVTLTLAPLARLAEQKMMTRLLDPEQLDLSIRFSVEQIQKADLASRVEAHLKSITHGITTIDEARDELGLNPYDGDMGNHPLVLSNLVTLDNVLAAPVPGSQPSGFGGEQEPDAPGDGEEPVPQEGDPAVDGDGATRAQADCCAHGHARVTREAPPRVDLRGDYEPLFVEALLRAAKREGAEVGDAAARFLEVGDVGGFQTWMEEYYGAHALRVKDLMRNTMQSYAAAVAREAAREVGLTDPVEVAELVEESLSGLAARWSGESQGQLGDLLNSGELPAAIAAGVAAAVSGWTEDRVAGAVKKEMTKAEVAATKMAWRQGGVTKIRWQTSAPCPLCAPLSGKVVGIEGSFLGRGTSLVPGGETNPMPIHRDVKGPPLHNGCECWLMPEI